MREIERNDRVSERRKAERRRKKQIRRMFVLLGMGTILVAFIFYVKDIKVQLKVMQATLDRIEALQYGEFGDVPATTETMDYVSSIGIINVDKPVQYTNDKIIQRLDELGADNLTIKKISENRLDYPEGILAALANNPEMADFAAGYLEPKSVVCRLTNYEKAQDFPLFLQWDPRWGYQLYGSDSNIGLAGCGPTCMSMVLYSLTGDEVLTPDKIAAYAMENNYYVEGTGTAWALMEDIPKSYGINVTNPKLTERAIKAELDKGNIIVCAMGEGDFTASGHFIVIYGYDNEGLRVNDPNCVARSKKKWSFHDIEKQIKNIWSYEKSN